MHSYKIFPSQEEASIFAADLVLKASIEAIKNQGVFRMVLTGGSSPLKLHQLLTEETIKNSINWEKTQIFWGDERFVAFDNALSNTRMAYETLIYSLPIPPENVFPMISKTQNISKTTVLKAADDYESVLKDLANENQILAFDLVFLGVGADAHTASWFPNTEVVHENTKWVSTSYNSEQKTERITLTPPIVLAAKKIVPLVFGKGKAATLKEVLEGGFKPDEYPSQLLRNAKNEVVWVLDNSSAEQLNL